MLKIASNIAKLKNITLRISCDSYDVRYYYITYIYIEMSFKYDGHSSIFYSIKCDIFFSILSKEVLMIPTTCNSAQNNTNHTLFFFILCHL